MSAKCVRYDQGHVTLRRNNSGHMKEMRIRLRDTIMRIPWVKTDPQWPQTRPLPCALIPFCTAQAPRKQCPRIYSFISITIISIFFITIHVIYYSFLWYIIHSCDILFIHVIYYSFINVTYYSFMWYIIHSCYILFIHVIYYSFMWYIINSCDILFIHVIYYSFMWYIINSCDIFFICLTIRGQLVNTCSN